MEPKEVKKSKGRGPYAVGTLFGWTINGPLGRNETTRLCVKFLQSDHGLNEQFQKYSNMEFNDSAFGTKIKMSVKDSRALEIMESSVQLRDEHYQVALLWRNFPPWLLSNRSLTEHRLKLFKKRLLNNLSLHRQFNEERICS